MDTIYMCQYCKAKRGVYTFKQGKYDFQFCNTCGQTTNLEGK